ncbi:MAG: enoyl-CoA hydratase/isomerase family protein [Vicinamibacteria bacterium]|nr:enoyl-CoA hydratase/isomerase family protein [Vicinamibacteria bacterium]
MSSRPAIRVEREGGVATVVMDSGQKRNALTLAMWLEVAERFAELQADVDLRCVVLRGGNDVFSAGADIAEFPRTRNDKGQARQYGEAIAGAMAAVEECPHPVIAAIRGDCVGGGLEIAAACDLRLASAKSRFGIPISRIGVVMAHAELQALKRLVGHARSLEILLTGEVFDAARAQALGLVNRVFEDSAFEAEVAAVVGRITAGSPLSNRWHKRFLRRLSDQAPLSEDERNEAYEFAGTSDYAEGITAFLEKRPPRFEGR